MATPAVLDKVLREAITASVSLQNLVREIKDAQISMESLGVDVDHLVARISQTLEVFSAELFFSMATVMQAVPTEPSCSRPPSLNATMANKFEVDLDAFDIAFDNTDLSAFAQMAFSADQSAQAFVSGPASGDLSGMQLVTVTGGPPNPHPQSQTLSKPVHSMSAGTELAPSMEQEADSLQQLQQNEDQEAALLQDWLRRRSL